MRTKISLGIVCSLALALGAGCGDDDVTPPVDSGGGTDAGPRDAGGGGTDAGTDAGGGGTDAGTDAGGGDMDAGTDAGVDPAVRGQYLVDHLIGCTGCHTPRNMDGSPDMTRYLAGVDCFVDTDPTDATVGCLSSRNLTNHATGLASRSNAEIKAMFLDGLRPDGSALANVMPYWVFHNMTTEDADAIVAYLRTVPGVDHTVTPRQAPWTGVTVPSPALMDSDIPMPTTASPAAMRGRYLAAKSGVCIECHTAHTAPGPGLPIDATRVFGGGEGFPAAAFGLPVPPFPATIYTANITPHATGIMGWTAMDVVNVIKMGRDRAGGNVCPPMPVGPMGEYGGITDADAADIAAYITALPPIDNMIPNGCVAP